MFSHVKVGTDDMEASHKFYGATLKVLGYAEPVKYLKGRYFWRSERGVFGITIPINGEPACHAKDQQSVDA